MVYWKIQQLYLQQCFNMRKASAIFFLSTFSLGAWAIHSPASKFSSDLENFYKNSKFVFPTLPPLNAIVTSTKPNHQRNNEQITVKHNQPCTCAVFLSGQFTKFSSDQPKGNPALLQENDITYPCTPAGTKLCTSKCLDAIAKYLPNSANIVCGATDRDSIHRERAYLFVQNCDAVWVNTNFSAGREFCCKNGIPYKCGI